MMEQLEFDFGPEETVRVLALRALGSLVESHDGGLCPSEVLTLYEEYCMLPQCPRG